MLLERAEKLLELFDNGYTITYSSGYVDGPCSLYIKDGEICLSSQVFSNLELSGLHVSDFTVTEEIDNWFELEL